jgi:hypothetical protein
MLLDAYCTPTNVVTKIVKKRSIASVLADIPPLESVVFDPLDIDPKREP